MRAVALLFLIVVTLAPWPAAAADGPLFLWTAERDGARIDLLGSVHAGRAGWYPLDERIEAAFAAADTVACELNVTDPAVAMTVATLAMQQGMYPEGESLQANVSPETWQRLTAVEGLPVPPAYLDRMRPGLAATMVAQAFLARAGLDPEQGIDRHLLTRAAEAGRPVVALETAEQQVALLMGPDAVIDAKMLEEALAETPESMLKVMDDLVAAWRAGDPAAMDAAYREQWSDDASMQQFHQEMLVSRNRGMADGLAARRGRWFVVVGALHLCGADGVPALLAEAGWTVRQVGAAAP